MSQATLPSSPYFNSDLFSGYYLDERVQDLDEWDCDDEARKAFDELRAIWEQEFDLVESYKEDELLDSWIDEVIDVLGFGTLSETTLPDSGGYNDRLLFDDDESRRKAARRKRDGEIEAMYGAASAVLEAKQWGADFTQRFAEHRSYRDASHQIKYYLEHTPDALQWGILTDGRKWRLYGTKDYATETYYEIDLQEILAKGDLEQFKYFYVFFRPAAFREVGGTSFLDTVWSESETAAQELGEDLQDNVFTALRVLGEGFVETNDLDIDPDDETERARLKEQSLVLLYRLMFVLYAEARHLIHPDDPDSQDEYEANFSLDTLRLDIHDDIQSGDSFEDFSEHSTSMWSRLQDLFRLVDSGEESLGIPPYNGGLFDDETHEFLAGNAVADRYIAEVIYRLGTTQDDGSFVLADYADLDTRHLGSIYEGLLEHEFRIAPEQYAAVSEDGGQVWKPATEVSVADAVESVEPGELYVVNDDGERKATGAYYTPDYVVSYIVEETVDPLIEEIDEDLRADGLEPGDEAYFGRFYGRVQDLTILDPAMGSGHFLTKATGYLTERVMEVVREGEQGRAEQDIRRKVAKECIYGVDLNGMAVELAKLSMWLETLATDQPLAFLDHHLKTGNSLVGSDITEVLADEESMEGQLTFAQVMTKVRKETLEHVMDLMQDLLAIDNETLSDIKSMEEIYSEIRADPLYQRLFQMANVHTAERFGVDVPEDSYEEMAQAIEDESDWAKIEEADWFRAAQATAEEEDFFHWELEYPEVFFGGDGEKRDDAGFDAIIGNPPWVDVKGLETPQVLYKFFDTSFNRVNIYAAFIERAVSLLATGGEFGYITPNSYLTQSSYQLLRQHILEKLELKTIVRLPDGVFQGVTMETAVTIASAQTIDHPSSVRILLYDRDRRISEISLQTSDEVREGHTGRWTESDGSVIDIYSSNDDHLVLETIESAPLRINHEFESCLGLTPYDKHQGHSEEEINNRIFHSDAKESEEYHKITTGEGIDRYQLSWEGGEWIRYGEWLGSERERRFFTNPRCVVRQIVSTEGYGIHATYSDSEIFHTQVGFAFLPNDEDEEKAKALVGILNSKLITFYHRKRFLDENKDTFQKILIQDAAKFPLPESYADSQRLVENVDRRTSLTDRFSSLNCSLLDHLGTYSDGPTLSDVGLTQPPKGSADSILQETTEQKPNLRVGEATVHRESQSTVEIRLTGRYKPDDEEDHDTDQWGYTETDPLPALRITDLTETEADLIEAFVPVAVDEAGGFAGFRETATKTNSLVDRLRKLTLPAIDDVREGLASYVETMERAEELEEKIQRTDDLIDEIVYELYGLTEQEIEIVEEAVGDS